MTHRKKPKTPTEERFEDLALHIEDIHEQVKAIERRANVHDEIADAKVDVETQKAAVAVSAAYNDAFGRLQGETDEAMRTLNNIRNQFYPNSASITTEYLLTQSFDEITTKRVGIEHAEQTVDYYSRSLNEVQLKEDEVVDLFMKLVPAVEAILRYRNQQVPEHEIGFPDY